MFYVNFGCQHFCKSLETVKMPEIPFWTKMPEREGEADNAQEQEERRGGYPWGLELIE